MTPLAHRIMKEWTLPVRRRSKHDYASVMVALQGAHCFECSAVFPAVQEFVTGKRFGEIFPSVTAFLPAERTWIEWMNGRRRQGIMLTTDTTGLRVERRNGDVDELEKVEGDGGLAATGAYCYGLLATEQSDVKKGWVSWPVYYIVSLLQDQEPGFGIIGIKELEVDYEYDLNELNRFIHRSLCEAAALLVLINTPKIIGRRQHMPHRGLERALLKSKAPVGKYPLHAWSEILLKVRPPEVDENDHEAHLTGRKALHFCRAHLRIRLGRLEYVRSHWRGDPALGIKQSRYRVEA